MKKFAKFIVVLSVFGAVGAQAQSAQDLNSAVLKSAYSQVGVTTLYEGSYEEIAFPGGDVPLQRGVCTDVVIRAYRSIGLDLQLLVNQDMKKAFKAYPQVFELSKPDPNIDHRRVLNLEVFFARHGQSIKPTLNAADYKPGDIVTWRLAPRGLPHIGIVSDQIKDGRPLIIHNWAYGAQVEDVLFQNKIAGHFRFPLK